MRSVLALVLAGVLQAACSAPSPDEAPDRGPKPSPAELRREADRRDAQVLPDEEVRTVPEPSASPAEVRQISGPASPRPAAPPRTAAAPGVTESAPTPARDEPQSALAAPSQPVSPAPPAAAALAPPEIAATAHSQLPPLPFTAYTTAPLTVAGTPLQRTGVRVEVVALEGNQARVLCSACPAPATGQPGQVRLDRLRAGRAPGGSGDALDTALMLRARWASGAALPQGATNIEMCALVDHGFVLDTERATWDHQGGSLVLAWSGRVWDQQEPTTQPTATSAWTCRAGGQPPLHSSRSPEAP